MEIIKKYPLGQLFGRPQENIDFAVLTTREIFNLLTDEQNSAVQQFHKHDFYTIFWLEQGQLTQNLDDAVYTLKKGDIFVASPGQVHENDFFSAEQQVTGGAILFTSGFIGQLRERREISELTFLDNIFSNPKQQLYGPELESFLEIVRIMRREAEKSFPNRGVIKSLLAALLLLVQQAVDSSVARVTSNRHIEVYKGFKHLLELYYRENKTLGFYARLLHISERHLNRLLKETSFKTAAEMLRGRSVLEARRMLSYTDMTISEIAESLGYADNSNFTKVFKKEMGTTPQAYRLSMS